ncbi:hypothetical protein QBZ16_004826 [Prototheca wickerhamii]|uniref:Sfi1 spindle body domain-containing protein n=1 Tax=Prototheca wickerhamii TaxID=3111 RepID=A0AAD9MHQ6_PROWI|nr:hypothetical protein QBZ16_004826 [Prototheca wickerhamii]
MSAGGVTLAPADRGGPGDTAAQLEVVTVGDGWFGLRSSVAGDRFLQARKHGAARLGFHSCNLGVWEQWRVASGAEGLEEPWDVSRPIVLQNRRLLHLELRVTLVRVGSFTLAGGTITPRSIAAASDDNPERGALRRISNAVTSEWVSHAEFERAQRAEAEARLAELAAAHARLRTWASSKLEALNGQLHTDVTALLTAIQEKSKELARSRADAEGAREAALSSLRARREAAALRMAFGVWRGEAALMAQQRAWAAAAERRRDAQLARAALGAWREHRDRCSATRAVLRLAVRRLSSQRLTAAFGAWRALAADTGRRRARAEGLRTARESTSVRHTFAAWRAMAQRGAQARERLRRLAAKADSGVAQRAFAAWREGLAQAQALGDRLDALRERRALRGALGTWRRWRLDRAARRQAADEAARLLAKGAVRRAFGAWRQERAVAGEREAAADALAHFGVLRASFAVWRHEASRSLRAREALIRMVDGQATRVQRESFGAWRAVVAARRDARALVTRRLEIVASAYQSATLRAWHAEARRRVELRRLGEAKGREVARGRAQGVLRAWQRWARRRAAQRALLESLEDERDRGRARAALALWRAGDATLLARAFGGWLAGVDATKQLRSDLACVAQKQQVTGTQLLRDAFGGWQGAAREAQEERCRLRALPRSVAKPSIARRSQTRWRPGKSTSRWSSESSASLWRRSCGLSSRRLAAALRAWREAAAEGRAERERVADAARLLAQRQRRRTLEAWRDVADEARAVRAGEADLRARSLRRAGARGAARLARAGRGARRTPRLAVERWGSGDRPARRPARGGGARGRFAAWRAATALAARNRRVMMHAVERRAALAQRAALLAWLGAVREKRARVAALRRFLARRRTERLAASFGVWRAATDERREARERLRRCLLAKQVAYRNFRAWYWDAFDEDVQDTLRTIFEVTGEGPGGAARGSVSGGLGLAGGAALALAGDDTGGPAEFSSPPRWARGEMPAAQQRRLTDSVTRGLASAGLLGARRRPAGRPAPAPSRRASRPPRPRAWPRPRAPSPPRGGAGPFSPPDGKLGAIDERHAREVDENDDDDLAASRVRLFDEPRETDESEVFLPVLARPLETHALTQQTPGQIPTAAALYSDTATPLAAGRRANAAALRTPATAGKALGPAATPATYLRGVLTTPRDAAARHALALARTPLTGGDALRALCSPPPSVGLSRRLGQALSLADARTPAREYVQAATPPATADKENQDIHWYQGVTPLHQDADRYLQEMGFEDVMERAVSSDAQTPPLATNPLSYLAM